MWHDNETDVDLLGFDQLVDMINFLIQSDSLLPLTIGIYGDWGSGKSSLMQMSHKILESDKQYVCVHFSPWRHESYDDVKVAFMTAVMNALRDHRNLFTKISDGTVSQAQGLWTKIVKRINWFRVFSFTVKGIGTAATFMHGNPIGANLAISGLNDIRQVMNPEQFSNVAKQVETTGKELLKESPIETETNGETIEQSIDEFQRDFTALLHHLKIKALLVFIDDLDRCLPPNIIETLEAMRLFLAVPKTAFIIGADERIIRHAIATRYPELPDQAINIGRDYLEKIVQFPIRIPPLNAPETETYLNLLGSQLYLERDIHERLVALAATNRRKAALDVAMNYGIAKTELGTMPPELETYMQLVAHIAPVLCQGLEGNPRQTKRFMNTLLLRCRLAKARGINLEAHVLAKLMILEYFQESYFRQLFQWQAEGRGIVANLRILEEAANQDSQDDDDAKLSSDLQTWLDNSSLSAWMRLEPKLAGINLEQYFHFSRDRISTLTASSRRLSQHLQELLSKLQSESDSERRAGLREAETLSIDDFRPVYETLLGRFQRDPRAINAKLGNTIIQLAEQKRDLIPLLSRALRNAPLGRIQSALPLTITTSLGKGEQLPHDLTSVLQDWSHQKTNTGLAESAKKALTPKGSRNGHL
jgi:predicted KAP-like P-loop ATPase